MNSYILIFFLLLSTVSGNAQFPAIPMPKNVQKTNTIDSANIRVLYALNPVDIQNTLNISLQTRSQNIHGCQDSYKV